MEKILLNEPNPHFKKKNIGIKKENAWKLVELLIETIKKLEADKSNRYYVKEAILFGSILTDKDKLGDIDVALEICRRDRTFMHYTEQFAEEDRLRTMLRNKKKSYSFHPLWDFNAVKEINPDLKYITIYKYEEQIQNKKTLKT